MIQIKFSTRCATSPWGEMKGHFKCWTFFNIENVLFQCWKYNIIHKIKYHDNTKQWWLWCDIQIYAADLLVLMLYICINESFNVFWEKINNSWKKIKRVTWLHQSNRTYCQKKHGCLGLFSIGSDKTRKF